MRCFTKPLAWCRVAMFAFASAGMMVSPVVGQQILTTGHPVPKTPVAPRNTIRDVKLDSSQRLHGEVRDAQGKLLPNTDVVLWQGSTLVNRTRTDAKARFHFPAVRGGQYRIATPDVTVECRAWTAELAPPNAGESLLVVANLYSARGQQPINEVFCFNPFLMGTIVAAAIAIPIALHDSGDGQLPDGS